jgi:pimeloyl-ACP methyl ester carboxylesterase
MQWSEIASTRSVAVWLVLSGGIPAVPPLLLMLATPANGQQTSEAADQRALEGDLVIRQMGSFFIDGDTVFAEHPAPGLPLVGAPGTITINQMYVEFQVPRGGDRHVPLVLIHGGDLTGATYETTPDGRMGWEEFFLRRRRPVYVPDQVGRGRSGFDLRAINEVGLGLRPVSDLPSFLILAQETAWTLFRFGPAPGEPFADAKFPVDAAGELSKQAVPDINLSLPTPNPSIRHLATLAERLDGAVLLGHSQSGLYPLEAALLEPEAVKGTVNIEPGGCNNEVYTDEQIATLATVPTLVVFGDHLDDVPFWAEAFADCQAFVERVNDAGGDAEMLYPPNLGIFGNSHMLMQDRNNLQIARLILRWVDEHVGRRTDVAAREE